MFSVYNDGIGKKQKGGGHPMAIMKQKRLFVWKEIEELGDLERLNLVIKYLPDEELMVILERERGKGRDKYSVRAVWNSILAGVVCEHKSVESLRQELSWNYHYDLIVLNNVRKLYGWEEDKNGYISKEAEA